MNKKAKGLIIALCVISSFFAGIAFGMESRNDEIKNLELRIEILKQIVEYYKNRRFYPKDKYLNYINQDTFYKL